MNVAQLLHELPVISNVEIVVTFLPKVLGIPDQSPRYSLLQRFQRLCKVASLGFAQEKMHMLRHEHVSIHAQFETAPNPLQRRLKDLLGENGR